MPWKAATGAALRGCARGEKEKIENCRYTERFVNFRIVLASLLSEERTVQGKLIDRTAAELLRNCVLFYADALCLSLSLLISTISSVVQFALALVIRRTSFPQ